MSDNGAEPAVVSEQVAQTDGTGGGVAPILET